MTDYVRRLVSGKKARFKDHKLDVELDLVYLTDQVIIMGYPASGVEGLYRNRREDVKKFLDHRHGKNYWIFNFCPIKENSYDSQYFEGRVSRYPFPDHHAPPLALMPLVAREMRSWLDGSSERVAVLHCKAGKGRSGTMACAYLLSLNSNPAIPLEKSYSTKEWAAKRADDAMDIIPPDDDRHSTESSITDQTTVESPVQADSSPQSNTTPNHSPMALKHVLDLHTSRRMKQPLTSDKKVKQGVSIPSQRRYLYYWSLILSHQAPTHLWSNDPLMPSAPPTSTPKVRLAEIKLRTKESGGMTFNLVRAANAILDRGSTSKGSSQVWVSLARYDDDLIELLEKWERYTRDEANVGRRRPGTRDFGSETLNDIFEGGKWDKSKMVRSFARLGCSDDNDITKSDNGKDGKIITYTLTPLNDKRWKNIQGQLKSTKAGEAVIDPEEFNIPASEGNSMYDLTQTVKGNRGVVLDAAREVRVKLYMGQVFMGWAWFIPTFHMPQPPPNGDPQASESPIQTTFKLTRKELDFPLGIGSSILDVEISLEWLKKAETETEGVQPLKTPEEEKEQDSSEPTGLAAAAQMVATPGVGVGDVVEAKQAGKD